MTDKPRPGGIGDPGGPPVLGVGHGATHASLRADVQADDVVSSLIGIFLVSGSPEQTGRMLDLLVAGVTR